MVDKVAVVDPAVAWRYEELRAQVSESQRHLQRLARSKSTSELQAELDRLQSALSRDPHPPESMTSWLRYERFGRPADAIRVAARAVTRILDFEELLRGLDDIGGASPEDDLVLGKLSPEARTLAGHLRAGGRLAHLEVGRWETEVSLAGGRRELDRVVSDGSRAWSLVGKIDELVHRVSAGD